MGFGGSLKKLLLRSQIAAAVPLTAELVVLGRLPQHVESVTSCGVHTGGEPIDVAVVVELDTNVVVGVVVVCVRSYDESGLDTTGGEPMHVDAVVDDVAGIAAFSEVSPPARSGRNARVALVDDRPAMPDTPRFPYDWCLVPVNTVGVGRWMLSEKSTESPDLVLLRTPSGGVDRSVECCLSKLATFGSDISTQPLRQTGSTNAKPSGKSFDCKRCLKLSLSFDSSSGGPDTNPGLSWFGSTVPGAADANDTSKVSCCSPTAAERVGKSTEFC